MTKANVGIFAAAAVLVAFVVGNGEYPKWARVLVATGALLLPFVLMSQLLWQIATAQFALVVSYSLLVVYAPFGADRTELPRRALLLVAAATVATMVASSVWPLLNGTSPAALVGGAFIRPLGQVRHHTGTAQIRLPWVTIVLTACGVYAALARPNDNERQWFRTSVGVDLALVVAGLSVLGIGLLGGFAAWLPAIALLPALAWISPAPPNVRLALRFLVPIAILQILHVIPSPVRRSSGVSWRCVCRVSSWSRPGWNVKGLGNRPARRSGRSRSEPFASRWRSRPACGHRRSGTTTARVAAPRSRRPLRPRRAIVGAERADAHVRRQGTL